MRSDLFTRSIALLLTMGLILALGISTATAQEKMKVAGQITLTVTDENRIEVGDVENHIMNMTQYEGSNVSTGENELMDGAQVVNMGFSDLVMGNGPHQGYVKLAKGDDTVYASWEGKVSTVVSEEGKPHTTVKGSYMYTAGTGQYLGIQGAGSYSGMFTSETTLEVDWAGEYFIGE